MAAFTNTTMLADTTDVDGFLGTGVAVGFTVATMGDLVGVYTEAFLCNLTKYDLVTNWGSLNAVYKLMFSEYVARAIALEGIKYDTTGYDSLQEAEDLMNIHTWRMTEIVRILQEDGVQDFMGVSS